MLVRQLEEELRMRMRQPNIEMQQQMEALYAENEHLTREIAILRDTIKVNLGERSNHHNAEQKTKHFSYFIHKLQNCLLTPIRKVHYC